MSQSLSTSELSWSQADHAETVNDLHPFMEALTNRAETAQQRQPASTRQSKSSHDEYWRSFYQQARQDAIAGLFETPSNARRTTSAPLQQFGAIFIPPFHQVGLIFADMADYGECPCLLPNCGETDHTITAAISQTSDLSRQSSSAQASSFQGVTFDLLLQGISDAIHGKADGTPPVVGARCQTMMSLRNFAWMNDGGLMDGNIYLFLADHSLDVRNPLACWSWRM